MTTTRTTTGRWARALGAALLGLLASGLFVTRSLAATPPPTPTITAGPTGSVTSTSATFRWSVVNAPRGLKYVCSLDGAAFTACTNGVSFRSLAVGSHTFQVESVLSGAYSTPATRNWTIDTRPPVPAVAFPRSGSSISTSVFPTGCTVPGLCGTATDGTGVSAVTVSLRQGTGNYWGGTSFSSRRETYFSASLSTAGSTSSAWSYALASIPVGTYTLNVKATDSLGMTGSTPTSSTFTITSAVAPPAPVVTAAPTNPSPDTSPTFSFTATQTGVGFMCSLDSGAAVACDSGTISYTTLTPASHCFSVTATTNGATSTPTNHCWTIVETIGGFSISGGPTASLSPGGTPQSIDLTITNPFPFAIRVLSIAISVDAATNHPGCNGPANLAVTRAFTGTATIPGNSTKRLSELAPAVSAAQWPQVQMIDASFDQNACKGAVFSLTYTGTASQ